MIDSRWGYLTVEHKLNVSSLCLNNIATKFVGIGLACNLCLHQSCFSVYTGEVIFDRNHPALPPDIIFSSEDDQMEFNPDIEKLNVCQY